MLSLTLRAGEAGVTKGRKPGAVLKDELDDLGVTPTAFARQIDVPANRISQIIAGKRAVTGDTRAAFRRLVRRRSTAEHLGINTYETTVQEGDPREILVSFSSP